MTQLKVTFDGEKPRIVHINKLLRWREWSKRERDRLELVEAGLMRRLSTDLDGRPCDVELAQ